MVYEVYKIQNSINNKLYIGITNKGYKNRFRKHLSEARNGSTFILHNAIRKYGSDVFTVALLETCKTVEQLKDREIFWISTLDTTNRDKGYNMTLGGDGTFGRLHSDETKEKISAQSIGRRGARSKNVKIINLLTQEEIVYSSLQEASIGIGKPSYYIRDLKFLNKSDSFTFNELQIEIFKPIKKVKVKIATDEFVKDHMKMMRDKSEEARLKNPEEFAQVQKQAKINTGKTKIIEQVSFNGEVVAEHFGSRDAAKAVTGSRGPIQHCLKGRINTAYGFTWRYKLTS